MEVLVTVTLLGIGYFFNRREKNNYIISNKKNKRDRGQNKKIGVNNIYSSNLSNKIRKTERDLVHNNAVRSR